MSSELLGKLNGRRFDMDDLESVGLGASSVFNILNKNKLLLCSEQPGRGRARKFCLIDVYVLAIARNIVSVTNSAQTAASVMRSLLLHQEVEHPAGANAGYGEPIFLHVDSTEPSPGTVLDFCNRACEDISHAPAPFPFADRIDPLGLGGLDRDWLLYTESLELGWWLCQGFDRVGKGKLQWRSLICINLTVILNNLDQQLLSVLERRYGPNF